MKIAFKVVKCVVVAIVASAVLLFLGVLFCIKVLGRPPYIILVPTYLPEGYTLKESRTAGVGSGRVFFLLYQNADREDFTYSCQFIESKDFRCSADSFGDASFVEGFSDFRPKNSTAGCALTLIGSQEGKKRAFVWVREASKHTIFSPNVNLSDQEAFNIANSLKPRLFFMER
ncbi:MAG: DUF4367 domain-containing protein [bacterium]|nr:DUF4367 domain-containing protein [bacterium]